MLRLSPCEGDRGKLNSMTSSPQDPACAVAHGHAPSPGNGRTLVAVFFSPVAGYLLHFGRDTGFRAVLIEPDRERADAARASGLTVQAGVPASLDDTADVVVTDHHRPELGAVLRDALASPARWVGVMGKANHPAPHIPALTSLGVPAGEIARVHRPIGLNIGSRTPAEIAISTLAGLIADHNGRPGGFSYPAIVS
jgi:xanthine/CO dehydrogenase XdhC/CoxF family maturation factor